MGMKMRGAWASLLVVGAAACSSTSSTAGPTAPGDAGSDGNNLSDTGTVVPAEGGTAGQASIGPSGGTVTSADGTATVTIPAGALAKTVTITVAPATGGVSPASVTLVGQAFTFGPEGQQFSAPAKVTLTYDPAELPSGKTSSGIVIETAPVGSTSFTTLTTTVVDSTHVSAETSHFSNFVPSFPIVGPGCSTNADCSGSQICVSGVCTMP